MVNYIYWLFCLKGYSETLNNGSKKYLGAVTKYSKYNAHELRFSNLAFYNFRMIIFHYQKILSLNFIITRVIMFRQKYLCFANFTGKHLNWSLFLIKLKTWRSATLLKKELRQSCFPINIAKFLRTVLEMEHMAASENGWKFLKNCDSNLDGFVQKNLWVIIVQSRF